MRLTFLSAAGLLCLFTLGLTFAQDSTAIAVKSNAININPLGAAISQFFDGHYEHLFGTRHGIAVEGGLMTNKASKGYLAKIDYRYHYFSKKNQNGLNSPFWGCFLYYEKSKNRMTIDRTDYSINYKALKAGVEWGRRWIFWKHWNACIDFGYGFPLLTKYDWAPQRPDNGDQLERVATLFYGLSTEISFGFAF